MNAPRRHADNDRPLLAITMGDPGGIGAEVVVKALAEPELRGLGRFVVYGLDEMLQYAADRAEIRPYWFRVPHEDVGAVESGVVVADFDEYTAFGPALTRPTAEGGHASLRFVDEAIDAARRGFADAVVTGPIHKTSWKMAGCRFAGHTEKFADAFKTPRVTMMFAAADLKVALATVHVAISDLRDALNIGCVFRAIDQLHDALKHWWGQAEPRLAVAGLNPHAGESGRFGDEETRIIEPAMVMARQAGVDVSGPFPADTLFVPQRRRRFDGIVAMYHDQGLIPVKMLAFDSSVNVTLGLPIIRTSVDHGTAMDIAFRNKADPGSMREAIRLACRLASTARGARGAESGGGPPALNANIRPAAAE
ncbi:MAG: 4-hydroxythreonine-4-phosphate dehydrogenase PdxA [Phycisphaerales bacterium]|nr:MAG: 4-hydroxythreonine-4-phosphate dehydrogenase PdxA [Phycisphaerales bacterium]